MNIMLVNFTDAQRNWLNESLGAQAKDITFQFLVEAIVMTICGVHWSFNALW
jgi:ABC-type antimicrobial peptide transport system permease subunit